MPAKRRSMADFLKEQQAIEDPLAGDLRPGLPVPEAEAELHSPAVPAVITAAAIPEPHSPAGHGQLTGSEASDLATCEAAIDNLRLAFWAAGKALQVIRDGRLYRASHDTFEEYAEERWDLSRAQAYRLIEAWPLAERLSLSPMGDKLNERQVRELVQVAGRHGTDAAATVYQAVAEADGARVTAAVLHDVVAILPADYWDPDEAVAQIRAYLAGERTPPVLPPADPVQAFTTETKRVLKSLQGIASGDVIRAARTADPDAVHEAIASVRAVLDEIEKEIT